MRICACVNLLLIAFSNSNFSFSVKVQLRSLLFVFSIANFITIYWIIFVIPGPSGIHKIVDLVYIYIFLFQAHLLCLSNYW